MIIRQNKKFYFSFILKTSKTNVLGNYKSESWAFKPRHIIKHSIRCYLGTMQKHINHCQAIGQQPNRDNYISHIISHEYIHKAIRELENIETCTAFDNIAGILPKPYNNIGIGIGVKNE